MGQAAQLGPGGRVVYRSMTSVIEVVKLQFVENLIGKRFVCYKGMYGADESDKEQ